MGTHTPHAFQCAVKRCGVERCAVGRCGVGRCAVGCCLGAGTPAAAV